MWNFVNKGAYKNDAFCKLGLETIILLATCNWVKLLNIKYEFYGFIGDVIETIIINMNISVQENCLSRNIYKLCCYVQLHINSIFLGSVALLLILICTYAYIIYNVYDCKL